MKVIWNGCSWMNLGSHHTARHCRPYGATLSNYAAKIIKRLLLMGAGCTRWQFSDSTLATSTVRHERKRTSKRACSTQRPPEISPWYAASLLHGGSGGLEPTVGSHCTPGLASSVFCCDRHSRQSQDVSTVLQRSPRGWNTNCVHLLVQ